MPTVTLIQCHSGQNSSDPAFKNNFEDAKERLEEDAEARECFMPGTGVAHERCYGAEFQQVCGLTPEQAAKSPWVVNGMQPGNTNQNYFLVALKGMSLDDLFSVRKVRIFFREGAVRQEHFLRPEDQLVSNQGKFIHKYVFELVDTKRASNLKARRFQTL